MSTTLPHYNKIFKELWHQSDAKRRHQNQIYQPCALQRPYCPKNGWPVKLPDLPAVDNPTDIVVIIHFQDSLTYHDRFCVEIKKVEDHYSTHLHHNIVVIVEDIGLLNYYTGNLHVIWFPTFIYETMSQMQNTQHIWGTYINAEPKKNWQCLNGIPKPWRKDVAYYLQKNFDNGILSLANIIPLKTHAYDDVYHGKGNDNPDNFLMLDWVYKDCALNIVCETIYDAPCGILTEKTLFAFLAGQVPITIAHQGYVKELIDMGFDMFTDIVNTSFDRLPDHTRWRAAIDLNAELLNSEVKRADHMERLLYNQNHALHTLGANCIEHYITQMHSFGFSNRDLKTLLGYGTS